MKKLLTVVALFALPVLLIYGVFTAVVIKSREQATLEQVVAATLDGELVLFGNAYTSEIRSYKMLVQKQLGADFLVLGTSRSMPFMGRFFDEPNFYNAGGGAIVASDYLFFLQSIGEQSQPKTLLLVLDQNMYSEKWYTTFGFATHRGYDEAEKPPLFNSVNHAISDYGYGKYSILKVLNTQKGVYGLAASGRNMGFRQDGSYSYGKLAQKTVPMAGFDLHFRDIDKGKNFFVYDEQVSAAALEELRALLSYCKERQIEVYAILPPFAPATTAHMAQNGGYAYMGKLPALVADVFSEYGYEFYDYTDMGDTVTDIEFVDAFHGGEVVYAKILRDMVKRGSNIASYAISEQELTLLINTALAANPKII